MTMLTICRKYCPQGYELKLTKEKANEFIAELTDGNTSARCYIQKATAPGKATEYAKKIIASGMCSLMINRGDYEEAKKWSDIMINSKLIDWNKLRGA